MQRRGVIFAVVGVMLAGSLARAEEAARPTLEPYVGEVAVKTLNVRSGPSTNYYVVTRLFAGTRVQVIGEEHGWLAIAPPQGCFSLIAKEYVDLGESGEGVVNADNVRVRAGTDLSADDYAVQLKLPKGATVKVLGPASEKYLKIEPPPGAKLWVSREYIRRVADGQLDPSAAYRDAEYPEAAPEPDDEVEGARSGPAATSQPATSQRARSQPSTSQPSTARQGKGSKRESKGGPVEPDLSGVAPDDYRGRLKVLDAALKEEMAKPLLRRDFNFLVPKYRKLAEQDAEVYVQAYARIRLQQIQDSTEMIAGLRQVRQLHDDVRSTRKEALTGRAGLWPPPLRLEGGFDAEGELRPSAVYDSPVGPQRYRLVEPLTGKGLSRVEPGISPLRTIGYVEIRPESGIDITEFLGRRVGVRARERILQTGDVNPIPIYVAAELVVLDRLEDMGLEEPDKEPSDMGEPETPAPREE